MRHPEEDHRAAGSGFRRGGDPGPSPARDPGLFPARDPVLLYLLATPLFAAVDAVFGWPVRVAGIGGVPGRWLYYGALLLLGLVCWRWPRAAPLVGMGESAANLTLLFLSVLLPLWDASAILAGAGPPVVTPVALGNLVLVGGALVVSFYRSQWRLGKDLRPG